MSDYWAEELVNLKITETDLYSRPENFKELNLTYLGIRLFGYCEKGMDTAWRFFLEEVSREKLRSQERYFIEKDDSAFPYGYSLPELHYLTPATEAISRVLLLKDPEKDELKEEMVSLDWQECERAAVSSMGNQTTFLRTLLSCPRSGSIVQANYPWRNKAGTPN